MTTQTAEPRRLTLDFATPQKVSYCIPTWLRDEQIRVNTALVPRRLEPTTTLRTEAIAVVCFGPSLNETWEQIRAYPLVLSCSGAHKFLIERGIVPTWHIDVDPRIHKLELMGDPHPDVEYLVASTCHPEYCRRLVAGGHQLRLWHIFDGADEALRVLPAGEWALTGGCSVGLRALSIARFIGFRTMHVFGMDGSEGKTGKHAAAHPNQAPQSFEVDYGGVTYRTTPAFLEAARQTPHELDDLKDVTATFHGDGLVQAIMRDYTRTPKAKPSLTAFAKPELITEDYRAQNRQLHDQNLAYGVGGGKHADAVLKLLPTLKTTGTPPAILDYGCGKGYLQKALSFPIFEYDPAVAGKTESPRPADLVCCFDVLEHIEPPLLAFVLDDLRRCVKQVGYFIIHTGPAVKTLPDGRNTHLIQQPRAWWEGQLGQFFQVGKIFEMGPELHCIVGPKVGLVAGLHGVKRPVLSWGGLTLDREPYVIGGASDVLAPEMYAQMVAAFPARDLFRVFEGDRKLSLSTVNRPDAFAALVQLSSIWKTFDGYVKTKLVDELRTLFRTLGLDVLEHKKVKPRWEFSMLPGDGGGLRPHTDLASKLVTLVLSMRAPGDEWRSEWGGGTAVLRPKPGIEPPDDYKAPWDAFEEVRTYPYRPNQAVLFIKSANSWHGVRPQTGPADAERRTLTVNIEKAV